MNLSVQKKIVLSTLVILMLLCIFVPTQSSFGAETPLPGSDHKLFLDGKQIATDVAPFIETGRTLVPANAVFSAMGAKVEWLPKTRQVVITYESDRVVLVIDSPKVLVNDQEQTLDVPARIVKSRTFVPVSFVSKAFSFGVEYDAENRRVLLASPVSVPPTGPAVTVPTQGALGSVTDIAYSVFDTGSRITVSVNQEITLHTESQLSDPFRYIVDLKGFDLGTINDTISPPSDPLIFSVRSGQFTPDTLRVVVDLKENRAGLLSFSPDKKNLYIDFLTKDGEGLPPVTTDPAITGPGIPETTDPLLPGSKKPASLSEVLIVIDPGHGGLDPGSQGKVNGKVVLNEKDLNLDIALRLNQKLQAAGFSTLMTRTEDTFADPNSKNAKEDLIPRAGIANEQGATLFVAIHNNSASGVPKAKGTETHYSETVTKAAYGLSSKDLALTVQSKLLRELGTYDRGIKSSPELAVLRRTNMPAIIIEGAFLSNASDLQYMQTDAFRENYANAAAEGIIEYLQKMIP